MTFILIIISVITLISFVAIVCSDADCDVTKPTEDEIHLQELIKQQEEDNNLD